ncbi:olfactory receptor 1020-like [Scleropages formosus]|uniref:olfactory receptor 1020-like n=1 Tax=Scleropages formosus TaxID=113540 RepID=UPI0010FAC4EE|nr:olfactory receptor 1020-like [Scleropages formosus]
MDNTTFALNILQLEGVDLAPQFVYPVFFILLVTYILTMITNTGLIILIAVERSLHQPMYLLFCNLSFNDIMGNTNILPRIMMDLFSTEKYIGYVECVTQAFCSHIFAAAAHVILMISLTLRLTRCRSFVMNVYCDNASLFKLSCQDVSINNTYGLAYTVFISGSSLVITIGTYLKIFTICFTKKSKELNSKALQTCSTHLVLYMIMLWSGFFSIIFHRIQIYSGYRKLMSILFHVVPANLNPIIYALQTKELKSKVKKLFHSKVSNTDR